MGRPWQQLMVYHGNTHGHNPACPAQKRILAMAMKCTYMYICKYMYMYVANNKVHCTCKIKMIITALHCTF